MNCYFQFSRGYSVLTVRSHFLFLQIVNKKVSLKSHSAAISVQQSLKIIIYFLLRNEDLCMRKRFEEMGKVCRRQREQGLGALLEPSGRGRPSLEPLLSTRAIVMGCWDSLRPCLLPCGHFVPSSQLNVFTAHRRQEC